jgi:hypothetical protein
MPLALLMPLAAPIVAAQEGPYQTPQLLYVGDSGTIVCPPGMFAGLPEGGAVVSEGLPRTDEVSVDRVEADGRGRVLVGFRAWRTGVVPLPPVRLGDAEIAGLQAEVASVLGEGADASMELSPALGPLSAPGTLWMFAGFAALALLFLAAAVLLWIRARHLRAALAAFLRPLVLPFALKLRLRRLERLLRAGLLSERDALCALSADVRLFLTRLWMLPCDALCAEEFLLVEPPRPPPSRPRLSRPRTDSAEDAGFEGVRQAVYAFFRECEEARFGGPARGHGWQEGRGTADGAVCNGPAVGLLEAAMRLADRFAPKRRR